MRKMKSKAFIPGLLLCFAAIQGAAQEAVQLATSRAGPYAMVERSDWSRYDNGKYTGHVYHEVRASIKPDGSAPEAFLYRGNFFVLEETLRDMRQSARPVDDIIPVIFKIYRDGNIDIENDRGFPSLRGFPAFPAEAVQPGSRWTANGSRAVDPKNSGNPEILPFIAEYEYRGVELYKEIPVHRVAAKYAMRGRGQSYGSFSNLQGTHTADILVQVSNGLPLLIRDTLDETYTWPDGSTLRFRGFTLIFNEGVVPINRDTMIASLGNTLGGRTATGNQAATGGRPGGGAPTGGGAGGRAPAGGATTDSIRDSLPSGASGTGSLDLVAVPEGIRLIVRDIRFIPDSDEFLPEERPRLDIIAQALKQAAPYQTFLVEGHTASLDKPAGEMELSLQRAKRMVEELARRGIPEDRFIYKGWGGTNPIGDNGNEQGRALNRRVEITILD
jgi:outer membrane protein OmpA-like peptidoglycan-associated protein